MLLQANNQLERLQGIDWGLMKTVIDCLGPFEKATKILQSDNCPTLHKVYQCYCMLKCLMISSPPDSSALQYLKKRGTISLQHKFVISDIHLLAPFFNPKFKSLVPLSATKKEGVHTHARSLLK